MFLLVTGSDISLRLSDLNGTVLSLASLHTNDHAPACCRKYIYRVYNNNIEQLFPFRAYLYSV